MIKRIRVKCKTGTASYSLIRPRTYIEIDEYDLLIEAICKQAARDLKSISYDLKTDAMDFFRGKWFRHLTGLDGETILQKLLEDKK